MFSYKYIFSNTIKIIQLNSNKKMNFQGGSSVKKPKIQLSQIIVFIILGGIAVISCLLHSNKPFDIENVSIFSDEKFYLTSYYLSSPYVFMILLILIFNFWNAHQSLIFLIGYEACVYFSSFFQLLFKKKLLFIEENKNVSSNIWKNAKSFSSPANESVFSTYVFLALTFISLSKRALKKKIAIKVLCYILTIIIIVFINVTLLFQKVYYLFDIIFGVSLGGMIFTFFFGLTRQKFENSTQLQYFIKLNIFYFVLGNIIPFAVFLFLFLFRMNDTDIKYENNINKDFEYVSLTKETFTRGLVFISNFIAIVAVKFEYLITFNKSEDNFSVYNFNITVETGADIETLYSSLNKTGGKRWNDTNLFKYLARVAICIIVFIILHLPTYFFFNNESYYYTLVLVINQTVVPILLVVFLFFGSKPLFRLIKLSN